MKGGLFATINLHASDQRCLLQQYVPFLFNPYLSITYSYALDTLSYQVGVKSTMLCLRTQRRARIAILLGVALVACCCFMVSATWQKYQAHVPISRELEGPSRKTSLLCDLYPDTGDIAVSLKTGATTPSVKLNATLNTSLQCVQDLMVFSDLEQTLLSGSVHTQDVLANFPLAAMEHNPDFDLYRMQKEYGQDDARIVAELSHLPSPPHEGQPEGHTAGWALDKYKFLRMIEIAYERQPGRDWYLFLEPDTYLSWPNLKQWLQSLNPDEKLFLGKAIQKNDTHEPKYFAQGGSGLVLSHAAIEEFAVQRKGIAAGYDHQLQHTWWAGDWTLADVLYWEMGLRVTNGTPMLNQLEPRRIPHSEGC